MTSRSVRVDLVTSIFLNRKRFFLRHMELNLRVIVMTIDEVTLNRPKMPRASASSVVSAGWDSPGSTCSSLLKSCLLTVGSRLRVGTRNSWSLPDNFAGPAANGIVNSSPFFCYQYFLWFDSSRVNIRCIHHFQIFQSRLSRCLLSKFLRNQLTVQIDSR